MGSFVVQVGDRSVGRLVFGTADTKAKMKVLALSSRTDVVADDFEVHLNDLIAKLSAEDKKLINKMNTMKGNDRVEGRCPIIHGATTPIKGSSLPVNSAFLIHLSGQLIKPFYA